MIDMSSSAPYRNQPEPDSDTPYRRAWRRRRVYGVGFVLSVIAFLASPFVATTWGNFWLPSVMVAFVVAGFFQLSYYLFRCPRCLKRFAGGFPIRDIRPRQCAYCGLAAGADRD